MADNNVNHAAPTADEPVIYTSPQSPHGVHENIQPAIEATDAFVALHKLVSDMLSGAPKIIDSIPLQEIIGANVITVDVPTWDGMERKSLLKIHSGISEIGRAHV